MNDQPQSNPEQAATVPSEWAVKAAEQLYYDIPQKGVLNAMIIQEAIAHAVAAREAEYLKDLTVLVKERDEALDALMAVSEAAKIEVLMKRGAYSCADAAKEICAALTTAQRSAEEAKEERNKRGIELAARQFTIVQLTQQLATANAALELAKRDAQHLWDVHANWQKAEAALEQSAARTREMVEALEWAINQLDHEDGWEMERHERNPILHADSTGYKNARIILARQAHGAGHGVEGKAT